MCTKSRAMTPSACAVRNPPRPAGSPWCGDGSMPVAVSISQTRCRAERVSEANQLALDPTAAPARIQEAAPTGRSSSPSMGSSAWAKRGRADDALRSASGRRRPARTAHLPTHRHLGPTAWVRCSLPSSRSLSSSTASTSGRRSWRAQVTAAARGSPVPGPRRRFMKMGRRPARIPWSPPRAGRSSKPRSGSRRPKSSHHAARSAPGAPAPATAPTRN